MRYYSFALRTCAEEIKEKSKINLKEYAWENPIAAMNSYSYKTCHNGLCFFAYREDVGEMTLAVFSYDEKKLTYREAYDYVLLMLHDTFCINKIKGEPCEITMYQFLEYYLEARRRDYFNISNRFIDAANLWIYNYYNDDAKSLRYDFK